MTVETLGERLARLENRVQEMEKRLTAEPAPEPKRGWRWFVGVYADSPDFDDVVRVGQEWRNADRPADEVTPQ